MIREGFAFLLEQISRALLSLRYRVEVRGLDKLNSLEEGKGALFLSNHPSRIDPLFLMFRVMSRFRIHPVVVEYIYRIPYLKWLNRLTGSLPIPNFDTSINSFKVKRAKEALDLMSQGLKNGEKYLLYPAARMKKGSKEILGGSSAAFDLVHSSPESSIVLVRISGMWGSSFSRALTGSPPDLFQMLWVGMKAVLKNLLFFTPRRKILVEFDVNPAGLPKNGDRLAFNHFLEDWYNRYEDENGNVLKEEPLQLVPYSCWDKKLPEVLANAGSRAKQPSVSLSSKTAEMILGEIGRILKDPSLKILPEMRLSEDLGMDSLAQAELSSYLIRHFKLRKLPPQEIVTVGDAIEVAERGPIKRSEKKGGPKWRWPQESGRPAPIPAEGKTLPESFLSICKRQGNFAACGDDFVGVVSYRQMKLKVMVLAERFKEIEETHVGVLLPSSVGTYAVVFALLFAGKVPVMLNWTLGPRYLDYMANLTQIKTVLTSWNFLERLNYVELGKSVDEKIVLLEDVRDQLPLKTKLRGLWRAFVNPAAPPLNENDPAVIVFTSGTESMPKGVPLSHRNLLENQRSTFAGLTKTQNDACMNALPPFHALGFAVMGVYPFLSGVKVAFHPDPTDSFALFEAMGRWESTLIISPPLFLKWLFLAADGATLPSMRLIFSGGEKEPSELFSQMKLLAPNGQLLIAYGTSECSPCVSSTPENSPPVGVGKVLPGVSAIIIHPETLIRLPHGEEGEICVAGPNVFAGYLNNGQSPFLETEGKKWYRTGDLGYFDKEDNLILSGRRKRFVKIGGEMVSLGAVEGALLNELICQGHPVSDSPSIALCSKEVPGGDTDLILFTTSSLSKEECNQLLKQAGFSNLIKISSVQRIDVIPCMATGKIDYRSLTEKFITGRTDNK